MTEFLPRLVSWNITRRCNLRCAHCYLNADMRASRGDELATAEALQFIDQLAVLCPGAMLVFSGGEPLMRADLAGLVAHAAQRGLLAVLGTNGVLLSDARVHELAECGLAGVGLSLDSLKAKKHDDFRGVPGAWRGTVAAIESCLRHDLAVQIHTTATRENYEEIPELIAFAADRGAVVFHLFFLVCTGRGQQMTDITPAQYEAALHSLIGAQDKYQGRMLIRARCAPHLRRLVHARGAEWAAAMAGCMAGREYLRVTPEAEVTPCPYIPAAAGNLREDSLVAIWERAPLFAQLRRPSLSGRCGACEYRQLCGGCRARAFAASGDLMAEDAWCEYRPVQAESMSAAGRSDAANLEVEWTDQACARLARVPVALRPMVERGVVEYARSKGLTTITPELMGEVRARAGMMKRPSKPETPS